MNRQNIRKWSLYLLVILQAWAFITILLMINFTIGDEIKGVKWGMMLQDNINDKNLTLPYPDFKQELVKRQNQMTYTRMLFDTDIDTYMNHTRENYRYSQDYDCKYWSYVHTLYFKTVKDKYNYHIKYITTPNHIFVMLYNESGYCTLDGDDYQCLMEN